MSFEKIKRVTMHEFMIFSNDDNNNNTNNNKLCNFDNSCGFCFALLYRAKIFCEALTQCVRQFLLV